MQLPHFNESSSGFRAFMASLAVALCVALICFHRIIFSPISVWSSDDSGMLLIAHSIHFDWFLNGGKYLPPRSMSGHPGVPFYIATVFSYLLSGIPRTPLGIARLDIVGENAGRIFIIATYVAVMIAAFGAGLMTWLMSRLAPLSVVLASMALGICSTFLFFIVSTELQNETFAFVITALAVACLIPILRNDTPELSSFFIFGAVGALAYANKLLYLGVPLAGFAVIVASQILTAPSYRRRALELGYFIFGFVVGLACIFLILGKQTTQALLRFHWQVVSRSGLYGSGGGGIVSSGDFNSTFEAMLQGRASPLLLGYLISISIIILCAVKIFRGNRDRLPILLAVWVTSLCLFEAASVTKHFVTHYVVAIAATLPVAAVALYALINDYSNRIRAGYTISLAVLSVGLFCFGLPRYISDISGATKSSIASVQDAEDFAKAFASYPKPIIFTYHQASRPAGLGFALYYSGVEPLITAYNVKERNEFAAIVKPPFVPKTVVVAKQYFKTESELRSAANLDPLNVMKIPPSDGDRIVEMRNSFVVVRP